MSKKKFLRNFKYKYELTIFLLIMLPAIPAFYTGPSRYYLGYLFDYKIGLTSRLLIGSIVDLLAKGKISESWLRGFITITYLVVFIIVTFLLGKLLRSVNADIKTVAIFMVVFILLAKYGMWVWPIYFGIFDIFWFLFTLLAIVFLENRYLKWLIPIFCVLGLATHYTFAFIYMPLFAALIYHNMLESKFSKSSIMLTVANFLTMGFASVYFFIFSNRTIRLNGDALIHYVHSKIDFQLDDFYDTIIGSYFNSQPGSLAREMKMFLTGYARSFELKPFLLILISVVPLIVCLMYIWTMAIKQSKNMNERLFSIFCFVLPLASLPAFIFSTDIYRLSSQFFISQFCLIFYLLYSKNQAIISSLKSLESLFKRHPELLFILVVLSLSYSYNIPGWPGLAGL